VVIVGGVVVGVAVLVVVLLSLGGGSKAGSSSASSSNAASTTSGQSSTSPAPTTKSKAKATPASSSPAGTNVVVLNGTATTGLAHRVSSELHQGGYTRATALNGQPPGTNQVTVVEYASGHRGEAQSVARTLGVSAPQPMEGTVSSLAGAATVVVIVGLDKAATTP